MTPTSVHTDHFHKLNVYAVFTFAKFTSLFWGRKYFNSTLTSSLDVTTRYSPRSKGMYKVAGVKVLMRKYQNFITHVVHVCTYMICWNSKVYCKTFSEINLGLYLAIKSSFNYFLALTDLLQTASSINWSAFFIIINIIYFSTGFFENLILSQINLESSDPFWGKFSYSDVAARKQGACTI